jgi:hypothetical protein
MIVVILRLRFVLLQSSILDFRLNLHSSRNCRAGQLDSGSTGAGYSLEFGSIGSGCPVGAMVQYTLSRMNGQSYDNPSQCCDDCPQAPQARSESGSMRSRSNLHSALLRQILPVTVSTASGG